MTVFAGDEVFAADINELIDRQNTTIFTGDSTTWGATETTAMSLTFAAISGAKYKIIFEGKVSTDVAADAANMRIREDNSTGTQLFLTQVYLPTTSGNGWQAHAYAEWTAPSTGNKTIVLTGQRSIGTGTAHRIRASGSAPAFFFADRIAN
jgi:hypothetical protein